AFQGHTAYVTSLAFSPDGKTLASGGEDKSMRTWEVETGKPLQNLPGHTLKVQCVAFSPDGKLVGSIGDDGVARIYNASSGQIRLAKAILNPSNNEGGYQIAFSPDGKVFATCGVTGPPQTYVAPTPEGNLPSGTGMQLQNFQGHNGPALGLAFSKDGKF